jgi:YHS domain-containing protein
MVKTIQIMFLALTLAAFTAASLLAADAKPAPALPPAAQGQPQTKCPVLGGNINKQIYVDYQGKRIYFCCQGCDQEFKKNPEKYMKKLKEQGVTLEPTPAGPAKK